MELHSTCIAATCSSLQAAESYDLNKERNEIVAHIVKYYCFDGERRHEQILGKQEVLRKQEEEEGKRKEELERQRQEAQKSNGSKGQSSAAKAPEDLEQEPEEIPEAGEEASEEASSKAEEDSSDESEEEETAVEEWSSKKQRPDEKNSSAEETSAEESEEEEGKSSGSQQNEEQNSKYLGTNEGEESEEENDNADQEDSSSEEKDEEETEAQSGEGRTGQGGEDGGSYDSEVEGGAGEEGVQRRLQTTERKEEEEAGLQHPRKGDGDGLSLGATFCPKERQSQTREQQRQGEVQPKLDKACQEDSSLVQERSLGGGGEGEVPSAKDLVTKLTELQGQERELASKLKILKVELKRTTEKESKALKEMLFHQTVRQLLLEEENKLEAEMEKVRNRREGVLREHQQMRD